MALDIRRQDDSGTPPLACGQDRYDRIEGAKFSKDEYARTLNKGEYKLLAVNVTGC